MVEFPSEQWKDYELLDSGRGEKLERFGRVVMICILKYSYTV